MLVLHQQPERVWFLTTGRYPLHRVSSTAWHGLVTAVGHLSFTCNALAATRATYPPASYTVLRTRGSWRALTGTRAE